MILDYLRLKISSNDLHISIDWCYGGGVSALDEQIIELGTVFQDCVLAKQHYLLMGRVEKNSHYRNTGLLTEWV